MRIEQLGSSTQEAVTADKLPGSGLTQHPKTLCTARDVFRPRRQMQMCRKYSKLSRRSPNLVPALEFSTDAETGRMVVKIMDRATGELVRQIPMEEMLALAKSLDRLQGLLFHTKA